MDNNEFGDYLRKLRQDRKMTIRQLEDKSGVSNGYISNFERGDRGIPHPDILRKLATPLGVDYGHLMHKAGYIDSYVEWLDDDDDIDAKWNKDKAKKLSDWLFDDNAAKEDPDIKKVVEWLEFEYDEQYETTKTGSSVFDKQIRTFVHLLIDDREREFFGSIEDALNERIGELFTKHNVESTKKVTISDKDGIRDDIPDQYADMIIDVEDVQFKYDVLQELQDIAHDFHIRFNPAYEVGARQPRPKKLENIVEHGNITYNDKPLEEQERKRILDMLELIFPDRQ